MATKKPKKKAARRAANKQRQPGLQERAVLALESIALSLLPTTLSVAKYKHTEVHGGLGVSPAELLPEQVASTPGPKPQAAPAVVSAEDVRAATEVAAVHRAIVQSVSHITDEELLS